jgi:hypothetical protein
MAKNMSRLRCMNQVKVFYMLDQNNVTFQRFKFSINKENAIHRYDQKE